MGMIDPGPTLVTLTPGTTVYFGFGWDDNPATGQTCSQIGRVESVPPNDYSALSATADLNEPLCGNAGTITAVGQKSAFGGNSDPEP